VTSPGLRRSRALLLAALVATGCNDAAGPEPEDPNAVTVTATGRVFTLDGTVPPGLAAIVVSDGRRTSVPIAANGSFSVTANVAPGSFDLLIDSESVARTTHPSLLRLPSATPYHATSFLLAPRRWRIDGGTHAGTTVDITIDGAFRKPCETVGDTNCEGFYPPMWATRIVAWPSAALPIPVAFDRTRTHRPISATDSVAFWQTVNRMNDDYGTSLFRPAREAEISVRTDDVPVNAILVRVDTTLESRFGAWTNWYWNGAGELYAGVVRPRTSAHLGSAGLITHEMLHTHGFKHSCSWNTVMAGYGGCSSAARLSPQDIAHAQLAISFGARLRQTGAVHGLAAARDGERALLGLPPLASHASAVDGMALLRTGGSDHAH
jgi:hypothetical protein